VNEDIPEAGHIPQARGQGRPDPAVAFEQREELAVRARLPQSAIGDDVGCYVERRLNGQLSV
jgi:hypothetical protein